MAKTIHQLNQPDEPLLRGPALRQAALGHLRAMELAQASYAHDGTRTEGFATYSFLLNNLQRQAEANQFGVVRGLVVVPVHFSPEDALAENSFKEAALQR